MQEIGRLKFCIYLLFTSCLGCSTPTVDFKTVQGKWQISNSWQNIKSKCLLQDALYKEKDSYWLKKKYKKNIYLQPNEAEHYFLYGRLLGLLEKPNVAMSFFHQALERDPEYLWALYSIGVLHLKKKSHLTAQMFLQRSIDIHFQFTPSLVALAKLKIRKNKSEALYLLFCAEVFSPKNIEIKQHIANVLALFNRYEESLAKYNEMHKISPKNTTVLNEWSKLLIKLKNYNAALPKLKKLHKLLPQNKKRAMEKTISLIMHLMNKE
ncbi:tetratricopeptide repeat protein [Candidatus Uabimicrobium sp. HlEnr_7]|uniref:tetratricopeptide repeat protein n=1 Tax=Candidatus Uabimicrobium helgolandensis TaxID=3095367 RepID=UPI0035579635